MLLVDYLADVEPVVAHKPIGLVKAMFAIELNGAVVRKPLIFVDG